MRPGRRAADWRRATVRARAFAAVPAVVAAALDAIDLLESALADVAEPQIGRRRRRIEAPAPGIAKAPRIDLGTVARGNRVSPLIAHRSGRERIGGRNRIGVPPSTSSRNIEPSKSVVSCAVLSRIAAAAAVAEAEVQESIGTERDVAAFVVVESRRLRHADDVGARAGAQRERRRRCS